MSFNPPKKNLGFSFTELLITVAVLSMIAVVSVPNFKSVKNHLELKAAAKSLKHGFSFARTKAVSNQEVVVICAKHPTNFVCDSSVNWSNGWLIFEDHDSDQIYTAATDALLYEHSGFENNIFVLNNAGSSNLISFEGNGFALIASTRNFTLCDQSKATEEAIGFSVYITGLGSTIDPSTTDISSCLTS